MSRPALTFFVLFFGLALLDAVRGGDWLLALFWVAVGTLFWMLETGVGTTKRWPLS